MQRQIQISSPIIDNDTTNPAVDIVASWKPVTMWNYFIILVIMIVLVALSFWGEYAFEKKNGAIVLIRLILMIIKMEKILLYIKRNWLILSLWIFF